MGLKGNITQVDSRMLLNILRGAKRTMIAYPLIFGVAPLLGIICLCGIRLWWIIPLYAVTILLITGVSVTTYDGLMAEVEKRLLDRAESGDITGQE